MTKDYRILAEDNGDDGMLFEIYEVYYDEDGNAAMHDEYPACVFGDDIDEILFCLNGMKDAINRPILWLGDKFPEQFDYDKWIKNKKL